MKIREVTNREAVLTGNLYEWADAAGEIPLITDEVVVIPSCEGVEQQTGVVVVFDRTVFIVGIHGEIFRREFPDELCAAGYVTDLPKHIPPTEMSTFLQQMG